MIIVPRSILFLMDSKLCLKTPSKGSSMIKQTGLSCRLTSILNVPSSFVDVVEICAESALLPKITSESVKGKLSTSVTFPVIVTFSCAKEKIVIKLKRNDRIYFVMR